MSRFERALVLGATGHVGQAVVRELVARGCRVTAATRRQAPAELEGLDVRIATFDAHEPGCFERWVPDHDLVIDAAAPYPLGMFEINGSGGPEVLGRALERIERLLSVVARSDCRLGYVSSALTLPRQQGPIAAMESHVRRGLYPYFVVKEAMERAVVDACERGLPAVIVNPSACLGPWERRRDPSSLVCQALEGRLPIVARQELGVIDVRDLAWGLIGALEQERYGEPIPLNGHDVELTALVTRVCELGDAPPPRATAPMRAAAAFAFWAEATSAWLARPAPMPVRAAPLIAEARPLGQGELQRAIGLRPRPLERTLRDAVAWQLRGRLASVAPRADGA